VQDPSLLAEDFQFLAPIVGPLSKAKFLKAFESFNLKKAFPGTAADSYGTYSGKNRKWFWKTLGTRQAFPRLRI
jgi:hypothetical protein